MPSFLVYLLRLSISLAVVWLFYQILLRRLTFYTLNRWYLLGYSVLSFFIPLINIYPILRDEEYAGEPYLIQFIPVVGDQGHIVATKAHEGVGWGTWLIWAFALGAVVLLVRTVIRGLSLHRLRKSARLIESGPLRIYQVDASIIPFSFGNSIYINQDLHTKQQWSDIILHEYVHIRQRHTVDILVAELICMLNWYNPFCWLIRWSIRQNLEFIADQQVLEKGVDKKGYQYHLLTVLGEPRYRLANNFNFSSLKKRIVMMNKIRSARLHLLKFLFVLPLAGVLLVAFRDKYTIPADPGYEGAEKELERVLNENVQYANLVRMEKSHPEVGLSSDHTEKAAGWPGRSHAGKSGGAVTIDMKRDTLKKDTAPKQQTLQLISPNALYVLNGEKMAAGWDPNGIPKDKILSVDVVKGEEAVRLFGKQGANGVVAITLKNYELHLQLIDTLDLKDKNGNFQPLYILDGKEVTPEIVGALNPNRIDNIAVHKADEVTRSYGEKGKSGVIIITLKKDVSSSGPAQFHQGVTVVTDDGRTTATADTFRIPSLKMTIYPSATH
jgi:BlaR1 peptidase M56